MEPARAKHGQTQTERQGSLGLLPSDIQLKACHAHVHVICAFVGRRVHVPMLCVDVYVTECRYLPYLNMGLRTYTVSSSLSFRPKVAQ